MPCFIVWPAFLITSHHRVAGYFFSWTVLLINERWHGPWAGSTVASQFQVSKSPHHVNARANACVCGAERRTGCIPRIGSRTFNNGLNECVTNWWSLKLFRSSLKRLTPLLFNLAGVKMRKFAYCKVVLATSLVWVMLDMFILLYFSECNKCDDKKERGLPGREGAYVSMLTQCV